VAVELVIKRKNVQKINDNIDKWDEEISKIYDALCIRTFLILDIFGIMRWIGASLANLKWVSLFFCE